MVASIHGSSVSHLNGPLPLRMTSRFCAAALQNLRTNDCGTNFLEVAHQKGHQRPNTISAEPQTLALLAHVRSDAPQGPSAFRLSPRHLVTSSPGRQAVSTLSRTPEFQMLGNGVLLLAPLANHWPFRSAGCPDVETLRTFWHLYLTGFVGREIGSVARRTQASQRHSMSTSCSDQS